MTALEALKEFVALEDLRERAGKISPVEPGCEKEVLMDEWRKRIRPAWAAARAVIAAQPEAAQGANPEWPRERVEAAAYSLGMRYAAQPEAEPPKANADYCRYGVCEPGEPHAPGCVEYTPAELAAAAPQAPKAEPVAWLSFDVARGKAFYDRVPIQSIQPGAYKHTPLYASPPAAAPLTDEQKP